MGTSRKYTVTTENRMESWNSSEPCNSWKAKHEYHIEGKVTKGMGYEKFSILRILSWPRYMGWLIDE